MSEFPIPETRVLAVASHVVSGHVGNKVAVFVLQALGCDVAALNTVHFSNHTGYGFVKGTRATAEQISELYEGLKLSQLDDFDMMLSGYIPGAAAVEAVGRIGKELREKSAARPGSFFWVLDPVMGDNGRLYVAEDSVAAYKALVPHVDLILPNQFEAEWLSGVKIIDMATMTQAIQALHDAYNIPHIVITSVQLSSPENHNSNNMSVIGSSRTSTGHARIFKLSFPAIDAYFSGTGDMFAALTVVRMREAVGAAEEGNLLGKTAWLSEDAVRAEELPLARAVEKVLASMHLVLAATQEAMLADLEKDRLLVVDGTTATNKEKKIEEGEDAEKRQKSAMSKAAELRLVRNTRFLRDPKVVFRAEAM